jgi:hypothetical protein
VGLFVRLWSEGDSEWLKRVNPPASVEFSVGECAAWCEICCAYHAYGEMRTGTTHDGWTLYCDKAFRNLVWFPRPSPEQIAVLIARGEG